MAQDQTTTRKHDIRASQLLAAALAAVTAAFLGSMLGTAGTVIGAGIASVVTTFAGALYQRSLDRTHSTLRTAADRLPRPGVRTQLGPGSAGEVPAPVTDAGVPGTEAPPADRPPAAPGRRLGVRAVALAGVLAFAVGIGAVSGFELLRGHPNSGGAAGTSIGSLFGQPTGPAPTHAGRTTTQAPTTATPPTTTPSPTTTTSAPSNTPSSTPSSSGSTSPSPSGSTTPAPSPTSPIVRIG